MLAKHVLGRWKYLWAVLAAFALVANGSKVDGKLLGSSFGCDESTDDPFGYVVISHSQWDTAAEKSTHRNDLFGLVAGADCAWHVDEYSQNSLLRMGVFGGYLSGKLKCSKDGSHRDSETFLGGIFSTLKHRRTSGLKTNADASIGFSYASNKLHRYYDAQKELVHTYDSTDLFAFGTVTHNLLCYGNWQCGPWMGFNCHRIQQKKYTDSTAYDATYSVAAADQDLINLTLGISGECEFSGTDRVNRLMRAHVKLGWGCRPVRPKGDANFSMQGLDAFLPVLGPGNRHFKVANVGFHYTVNRYWDIFGSWNGTCSKNFVNNVLVVGASYNF
ncbi:MAG: autotransporter outer membrane beta-barrel domain-containing protein [Puniceicoccales bacterium]|jgi:hypothetical protein|nr:autotransporter outer membrane beta-barrel domain-containing protein [Puniceicoccales bacterium]